MFYRSLDGLEGIKTLILKRGSLIENVKVAILNGGRDYSYQYYNKDQSQNIYDRDIKKVNIRHHFALTFKLFRIIRIPQIIQEKTDKRVQKR